MKPMGDHPTQDLTLIMEHQTHKHQLKLQQSCTETGTQVIIKCQVDQSHSEHRWASKISAIQIELKFYQCERRKVTELTKQLSMAA